MATSNNSISGINNIEILYNKIFEDCTDNLYKIPCSVHVDVDESCFKCNDPDTIQEIKNKSFFSRKKIIHILKNITIEKKGFLNITFIIDFINRSFFEQYRLYFDLDLDSPISRRFWMKGINFNKDCIFLIKVSGKKTILLLKDKITNEIIEKIYSYEDYIIDNIYIHLKFKPKYIKNSCCCDELILIKYFKFIFEKFKIFSEYKKTIENIYKNNLTKQLCKKYLNYDIETFIEEYL